MEDSVRTLGGKLVKILCVIRQVPDAEARVRTTNGRVQLDDTTLALDGMDEYGVEQAIRLGGDTVAVTIGPARAEDAVRRALAMGLERAVHVVTDEALGTLAQARIIARVARDEHADLVLTGGQNADTDSQALGAAVAELLDWPQITWTTELSIDGDTVRATHDTDEGKESVTATLPAVITTQQGLNEPRYPTLPNIMKAKKKDIQRRDPAEFDTGAPAVRVVDQTVQERARRGTIIDGRDPAAAAQELARLLHDEAKVI